MPHNTFSLQGQTQPEIVEAYAAECLRCGACCLSYTQSPFKVLVQMEDSTVPAKFVQIGPRFNDPRWPTNRYMRIVPLSKTSRKKKCAAQALPHSAACTIYDKRPLACSGFSPGSPACIASRDWLGFHDPPDVMALGRS